MGDITYSNRNQLYQPKSYKRILLPLLLVFVLVYLTVFQSVVTVSASERTSLEKPRKNPTTWIVKWKQSVPEAFLAESTITRELPELNITIAKPTETSKTREWLERWSQSEEVVYIQENQSVSVLAAPNDTQYAQQRYLRQIRAAEAWDEVSENKSVTIAIVDTGVDLTHPDLVGNLVQGVNLVQKGQQPQDDNGHGTNIAGIIGAQGNNQQGIAGVLWQTKIMPIKALEADGHGDEDKLGEGIRYAVDNGAKIVVLSVGLYRYSPFLEEIVEYAEEKGVLLVSATGNDGESIKYPAAYPTVLAVGGVTSSNTVHASSNYGPELDLVAPWNVYTTALGGGYEANQGTSMAAPQVAATAALVMAKNPNLKPYQVRSLIRQTAQNLGTAGWDQNSGYGLLRADFAVTEAYKVDMFENNDTRTNAKALPLESIISASFANADDEDWFFFDAPYDGHVTIQLSRINNVTATVGLTHIATGNAQTTHNNMLNNSTILKVKKGRHYIRLSVGNQTLSRSLEYKLSTSFTIAPDPYEDNDRQFKAYTLQPKTQTIRGNFHQLNDHDWFSIQFDQPGALSITLSTDTMRIDPALQIHTRDEKTIFVDNYGEGWDETLPYHEILPGKYFFRITNMISDQAYSVNGEYTLNIEYTPKFIDPNEPNDRSFQSTLMSWDTLYNGVMDRETDVDWFSIRVSDPSHVQIQLNKIPANRRVTMNIMDNVQNRIYTDTNAANNSSLRFERVLQAGTYYIQLSSNQVFDHQMYEITAKREQLIAGFRDISGHWAQKAISNLANKKIIGGYADHTFRPSRTITRAEAITFISRAFQLKDSTAIQYRDLSSQHWAYENISTAVNAGIVRGYEDGSFKPDQAISRAEMAIMIAGALKLKGVNGTSAPFKDVARDHWAAGMLRQLKSQKIISGYEDGTYKPNQTATRAEFISILDGAL